MSDSGRSFGKIASVVVILGVIIGLGVLTASNYLSNQGGVSGNYSDAELEALLMIGESNKQWVEGSTYPNGDDFLFNSWGWRRYD